MAGQADLRDKPSNESPEKGVAQQNSSVHGAGAASDPPDGNGDDGDDDPDPDRDDDVPPEYRRCNRCGEQLLWSLGSTWAHHNSVCTHRVASDDGDAVNASENEEAGDVVNDENDALAPSSPNLVAREAPQPSYEENGSQQQAPAQMEPPSPASE